MDTEHELNLLSSTLINPGVMPKHTIDETKICKSTVEETEKLASALQEQAESIRNRGISSRDEINVPAKVSVPITKTKALV